MALALLASGLPAMAPVTRVGSPKAGNGTILEIADGFPYTSYEQWLGEGRSQMAFDEARVRSQVSPERFRQNKTKLQPPDDPLVREAPRA